MSKLIIFVSRYDDYSDRAEKIKKDLKNVEYYFLEDIKLKYLNKIIENNTIFFLTNSNQINRIIDFILKRKINCNILNLNFFLEKYNKLTMQKKLEYNGVIIPKLYNSISEILFPVYVKSINHSDFIVKIYNKTSLGKIKLSAYKKCYFEEAIDDRNGYEYKIYYVNNKIFYSGLIEKKVHVAISKICNRISNALKLEVFSTDIIFSNKKYYVIDVNPAPGLWNSEDARITLGEKLYEK